MRDEWSKNDVEVIVPEPVPISSTVAPAVAAIAFPIQRLNASLRCL